MARIIQISELTYTARDGRRLLEDVFLGVERGELVGIWGPTGAGKTLLIELLSGEVKPRAGQILVNDRNVTRLSPAKLRQLRQYLGIVPQHPLWPGQLSLEEALRFKLSWLGLSARQATRKIEEVIELLGLASLRGQGFAELSELERRTAYLGMAICHDPILLLCDDPYGGLGEEGEATLAQVVRKVHQVRGLTTLITSRTPEPLRRLESRLLRLANGTLREED